MKERQKNIGLLLGVLAVLLVVFFIAKGINANSKKEEAKNKEAQKIYLYEADSLSRISYEDSDGQTMEYNKEGDVWKYTKDPAIEMDQDVMQMMEITFSGIQAVKKIDDPDPLPDYGLETPAYTLTLVDNKGKETKILIGNPAGENYYMKKAGSDKVYTAGSEIVEQMVWDVSKVTVKEKFVSVTENNFIKQLVTLPDGSETLYEKDNAALKDEINTITGGYSGMYFSECVDYHVTEDTIHNYGLGEGERTKVVLTYQNPENEKEDKEVTFYIGSKDETGSYYYVQLDGSLRINKVTQEEIDRILCKVIYEE